MTTLNDFITKVKKGVAKQELFQVEIYNPAIGITDFDTELLALFCESAQMPSINLLTQQHKTYGESREVVYDHSYDNVNLTFYLDHNMEIKKIFDKWMFSIVEQESREFNFYNDYVTTVTISQLDHMGNKTYEVTLYEAFPKSIGAIEYSAGGRDVSRMSVTMNYKYWRPSAGGTNGGAIGPIGFSLPSFANMASSLNPSAALPSSFGLGSFNGTKNGIGGFAKTVGGFLGGGQGGGGISGLMQSVFGSASPLGMPQTYLDGFKTFQQTVGGVVKTINGITREVNTFSAGIRNTIGSITGGVRNMAGSTNRMVGSVRNLKILPKLILGDVRSTTRQVRNVFKGLKGIF